MSGNTDGLISGEEISAMLIAAVIAMLIGGVIGRHLEHSKHRDAQLQELQESMQKECEERKQERVAGDRSPAVLRRQLQEEIAELLRERDLWRASVEARDRQARGVNPHASAVSE